MLAGGPRDPGMTVVSVEVGGLAVPDSASPRHPAPSVVNQLLAEFRCEDYGVVLTHSPLVLRTTDLDYLLKELSEIDHHVQVVVAATDNIDQVENTQETLRKIMAPATGMCATFVLDPQATRLFNERVTHSHAIEPGSLRIYVPGAQFGNPEDGNVHRKVDITAVLAGSDTGNLGADLCTGAAEFAASQTLARRERRYLSVLGECLRLPGHGVRGLGRGLEADPGDRQAGVGAHLPHQAGLRDGPGRRRRGLHGLRRLQRPAEGGVTRWTPPWSWTRPSTCSSAPA